jgi:intracellular sulfur oxidation DsrE/DsrF family protein
MKTKAYCILTIIICALFAGIPAQAEEPVNFVVQLTRSGDNYGHRRAFLQIDKVLNDLGPDKVRFVVVAYEEGIQALLAENKETNQLLTKLSNAGVVFKACRISMNAWDLKETEFPLEVEFVPAGAPEVINLQIQGYKYWRP